MASPRLDSREVDAVMRGNVDGWNAERATTGTALRLTNLESIIDDVGLTCQWNGDDGLMTR